MKPMTGATTSTTNEAITTFQFPLFKACDSLSHFSTTRQGGVSTGAYDSFNLGAFCGDEAEAVMENRRRLCRYLSVAEDRLFVPCQVHGAEVLEIDDSFLSAGWEEQQAALHGVDALFTRLPGVCVAVTTADCVPVLLYAPDQKIVAAIHAGWRGTVAQIASQVARLLIEQYHCDPHALLAGIGPSISQTNYEVSEELVEAFRLAGSDLERIVRRHPETHKPHIDLWEANRLQLLEAGLLAENIDLASLCTYAHPEEFFSARRQGLRSGRMLTGGVLTANDE